MTQSSSLSLSITSQYLDEIQTNIRVRPIPWEGYVRANLLSTHEAGLMKSIEKQSRDKRNSIVESDPKLYASSIIELLNRITRDDVVKYILSLAGDFAIDVPEFSKCLLAEGDGEAAYSALVKLLEKNDEQIHLLAAKTLVILLSSQRAPEKYATSLFTYLATKLASSPNVNLQDIAVQSYGLLLRTKCYRSIFWSKNAEIVPPLLKILDTTSRSSFQLQYYTLLIFWLITFETYAAAEVITKYEMAPILMEITKNSVKEKIIRVALATLVNTIKLAPKTAIPSLLSYSTLPLVKTLSERKWADEELIADLETLQTTLQDAFDSMTTFDEYKHEIEGRKLRWTPPHRSELFWKQNIWRFKEVDYKMVKLLSSIVAESTDNISLAVACSDINHVIEELPEAMRVLEKQGAKIKVMELMNNSDPEVRYEALKATQAFISHSFK
ncbi:V-type proton ATPase subunit H [Trichomonascus vanleenenianus]|uniref:H(+)-transporting V1 sector ATPase subunit H n=1 Tax=Trichomonascus vanleenenianus TaxID=2268995 RepID=UPI003ECACFF8